MHDYQQKIPDQLAGGIRVLIYAGDQVPRTHAHMSPGQCGRRPCALRAAARLYSTCA